MNLHRTTDRIALHLVALTSVPYTKRNGSFYKTQGSDNVEGRKDQYLSAPLWLCDGSSYYILPPMFGCFVFGMLWRLLAPVLPLQANQPFPPRCLPKPRFWLFSPYISLNSVYVYVLRYRISYIHIKVVDQSVFHEHRFFASILNDCPLITLKILSFCFIWGRTKD